MHIGSDIFVFRLGCAKSVTGESGGAEQGASRGVARNAAKLHQHPSVEANSLDLLSWLVAQLKT